MSWWGSSEQEISYPELKTPSSPEEIKAIADETVKEIMATFDSDEGWNKIPFTEEGGEGIELFDKVKEGEPIVPVKARGLIKGDKDAVGLSYFLLFFFFPSFCTSNF